MIIYDNAEMSDVSMAGCSDISETNTPETTEEKRKRKNREKSARYREKHPKKSLSDKELDDIREKGRLRQRKYVANKAQKKAQKEQAEAAASKLGLNNSGGGDGVVKNSPIDNVDTKDVDEDAG